ncbi:MAG: leucine-rich repeat domain-containing protein [Clostridia bacterium]|nr:leucine-rich repeat domain-containing protein [Clostridia bacterium]
MKTNKKAISLIVLVITIIVLAILAATVIINLSNTNIIEQASKTAFKSDMANYKEAYNLYLAGKYADNPYFDKAQITEADFDTIFAGNYSENLKVMNGELAYETLDSEEIAILDELKIQVSLPAGLYETGTRRQVKSWDELVADGTITISNGELTKCLSSISGYLVIDNTINSIGQYGFGSTKLANVVIPNSVSSIGKYAFVGSSGLQNISIPGSVASIGYGAFTGCTSLVSVVISEGVASIEGNAFSSCAKLTNVVIPNSVTSIGLSAFGYCTALADVYYTGTEEEWEEISIVGGPGDTLTNATIHFNYIPN